MKNKSLLVIAASLLLGLTSCGGSNASSSLPSSSSDCKDNSSGSITSSTGTSSDSSSTSVHDGEPIDISMAASILEELSEIEVKSSSNAKITEIDTINATVTTNSKEVSIYSDGTSSSEGSIYKAVDGKVSGSVDSYKGRKFKRNDSFISGGVTSTRERLYWGEEHSAAVSINDYTFVTPYEIATSTEAAEKGYSSYIPTESVTLCQTAMVAAEVHDFIASVNEDTYLLGNMPSFYMVVKGNETTYSFSASYSYSGDLGDTVGMKYEIEFVTVSSKLIKASYSSSMEDYRDESDRYVKSTSYLGELSYDTRSAVPVSGLMNVDDYLLSDVSDISLHSSGNGGSIIEGNISKSSSYVSASPKTYSPEKAITGILKVVASEDETILKPASGSTTALEVKGKTGSANVRFSYEGRDENGYFLTKYIDKELTVSGIKPTSMTVYEDENIGDNVLIVGKTYTSSVYLSASGKTADSVLNVASSNPEAIEVSESNGKVSLVAKKAATDVVISISSAANSELKKTFTYSVEDKLASSDVILNYTYSYTNHLVMAGNSGYTFTLNFNGDGTGSRVQVNLDNAEETYTDTFSYTISEDTVTFTWDKTSSGGEMSFHAYKKGEVKSNGRKLICYEEDSSSSDSSSPNDTSYSGSLKNEK